MPIKITDHTNSQKGERGKEIAWLCDDCWRLPDQVKELDAWLQSNRSIPKGSYSADIGFSPREDAFGGGGHISLASMQIMLNIGMELYLSEYPQGNENEQ